ncbi:hypothetical protein BDR05DRAFT_967920 [Suillus weaverae]|nr:hypothetical protein BDR05DRAFT_967920 [Suillus weaverae]
MVEHAVLHVVQASYGDALLLEYDPTWTTDSTTIQFMLIDGGPSRVTRYYVAPSVGAPKTNLFNLLNYLSGEDPTNKPKDGLLHTLETVVLTHDDKDHKQGIQDLFAALLTGTPTSTIDRFNAWLEGNRKLAGGKSPILNIWYNSLRNITTAKGTGTVRKGWFDLQLSSFAAKGSTPTVDSFNAELAVDSTTGVAFAMHDAKSRSSGSMVTKGQFTIQFLGPSTTTLNDPSLITQMSKPNSITLPKYKFQLEMNAKSKKLSNSMLSKAEKLGKLDGLVSAYDRSIKNLSSIAFDAEDKGRGTKILLLGDSTAQMFYSDYTYTNARAGTDYSLMKIMHHGSYHNNFWKRDPARKKEEADLPPAKAIAALSDFQRDVVFFFAKVSAKKYVISASALEMHPNPHSSTVIGIIVAALETSMTVDVYFTNPLSPWVTKAVGRFLRLNKLHLTSVRMHLMGVNANSGTVALYSHESDRNWELFDFSGKDVWSTFSDMLKLKFPTAAGLAFPYLLVAPPSRKRTHSGTIIPSTGPIGRSRFPLRTLIPVIKGSPQSPGEFGLRLPSQAPAFVRVPHPERTVSSMLLGTPLKADHDQLSIYVPSDTRTFTDLASLLQYLVGKGCLSSTDADSIVREAWTKGGYVLSALTTVFMGKEASEAFLASLPCDLLSSTDYLSEYDSPSFWVASRFVAKVINSERLEFRGWRGIYSISFDVTFHNHDVVTWNLPFGMASPKQASDVYLFQHDRPMSFTILWPSYLMRLISGQFQGTLQWTTACYHIVANFSSRYEQPTEYIFKFSDDDYETNNFKISIGDILRLLNCTDIDFGGNLGRILLPGIESVLDNLKDATGLSNGQFVLQKILSKVLLKDISGEVIFDDAFSNWRPFGSTLFSFTVGKLRARFRHVNSVQDRKFCVELEGSMDFNHSGNDDIKLPFELSASFMLQGFMLFEVTLLPGNDDSLSVSQLLNIVGLSKSGLDLGASFPAISNLSNALSITHISMGWTSSLLPDFFKLAISLDDWDVMGNALHITESAVEIQADNLSSDGPISLSLHGRGCVEIADIEFELFFNFAHAGAVDLTDSVHMISVQIAAQERPIRLGAIIKHFFGDDFSLLPQRFVQILDETGIDNFIIQAMRSDSSWSISQLQLSVRVEAKLDIFADMTLEYPTFLVDICHPFDSAQRTSSTCINAILHVGDVPSTVSIIVTSEDETEIALVFAPSGSPLTVRDMVGQFIPDSGTVTLPDAVSFLADIGLQQASVAMHLSNGKFSLSQLLVSVVSTSSLKLWDEITLEQVSFLFSYTKGMEKMAEFHSMLSFANNTDYLDFSLVYKSTSGQSVTNGGGSSLTAKATYSSTISILDILRRVSGIDLGNCFEKLSLSALTSVVDINMSNLTATLMHDPATNAFSFDADTDWLCFSHLRFAFSKSQTWSYSLGFSLRPDIDVLRYIPILGPIVNSKITLTNVALVVFNHILDVAALPTTFSIPANSTISQSLFNVAFAGRLTLANSPLKTLAKALDVDTIDILGIVGDKYLHLSISVKTIYLWNGEVSLVGSVVLICSDETEMLPKVGIQGTAVLNFGEQVSKDPITTSLFLFVDFSTTALGFKFTLDQWKGVFGYDGLNFENVVFDAEFPPEELSIPSEFTVSGTVDLSVKKSKFYGSVNLHFLELDILKSYAMGRIEGLTLNNIIEAFSDAHDVPDYLDLGFGPLEFKIVPIDLVDSKGNVMNQQFAMRGSFKIPSLHFSADGNVNICTSHVIVDGHLSPVVVLHKKLFSILASSDENPPPPSGSGASIHVSVNDGSSPFGVKISGRITFISVSNDIYLEASSDGLAFSIDRGWATDGSLSGIVNKEKLAISASYTFRNPILIPTLQIGSVLFGDVLIVSFCASLDTTVDWSALSWVLTITGNIIIHDLTISKSFTVGADLKDLTSLAGYISSAIKDSFASDLVKVLNDLIDDIQLVLTILQDFGLALFDMITFIVESCDVDVDRVPDIYQALRALEFDFYSIVKAISKIFEISETEVWKLIHGTTTTHKMLAQVQDELQLTLTINMNKLLGNSFTIKSSSQLSTVVHQYAILVFKKQFGYDYNGTSTTPSDATSLANLTAADGICSCTDGKQDHVGDFMKRMLNAQNVPDWTHDQAQCDLLDWTNDLVNVTTRDNWRHIAFVQTYNPQDESKQNSIQANAILVFVNGSLTIDDVTAIKTVVYYVGVYYEVITPSVAARQNLRTDAYEKASSDMNNNKAITDDKSLTTALKSYTETLFKDQFSYKWGGNPSDYTDGGSYMKVNADALGYFEGGKTDGVGAFVKNTLLTGVSLPDWISDTVISDVVSMFTTIITYDPYNGSWSSLNVDKMYNDSNGVHNSLEVNAVVVYYLDSKTIDNGTTVKIVYVFWMGMFYEKPSPATVVYNDMIKQLYANLHSAMGDVSTDDLISNKEGLITLLSRCASSKFKSDFGYDFSDNSTTPSDSNGDEVYSVECFGEFKDVTKDDVSSWTKDKIFKNDTFSFFTSVPVLESQLDDQIFWRLTQDTVPTIDNNWGIAKYNRSHSHPSDSSKLIETAAAIFYANGLLSESENTVKSNFLYYMGVYYVANDPDSGSDV